MNVVLTEGAKRDLLDLIKRRGAISLEEAVSELGLAKTTLRQHLLAMETQGLVRRKYERAGQGRPKVIFEIAHAGQRLYPTQEPALLRELLEHLKSNGQQATIQAFFERYWSMRRQRFEEILRALPPRKSETERRLAALQQLLESEGFMPQIERSGDRITVRECHCPFPEAIRATRLPCRLESEFIQHALKAAVERTGYLPEGDPACTYSSKKK